MPSHLISYATYSLSSLTFNENFIDSTLDVITSPKYHTSCLYDRKSLKLHLSGKIFFLRSTVSARISTTYSSSAVALTLKKRCEYSLQCLLFGSAAPPSFILILSSLLSRIYLSCCYSSKLILMSYNLKSTKIHTRLMSIFLCLHQNTNPLNPIAYLLIPFFFTDIFVVIILPNSSVLKHEARDIEKDLQYSR